MGEKFIQSFNYDAKISNLFTHFCHPAKSPSPQISLSGPCYLVYILTLRIYDNTHMKSGELLSAALSFLLRLESSGM
jgi:hypothetical protein